MCVDMCVGMWIVMRMGMFTVVHGHNLHTCNTGMDVFTKFYKYVCIPARRMHANMCVAMCAATYT